MVKIEIAKEKIEVWKIVCDRYPYTNEQTTFYSPYISGTSAAKYKKGLFTYAKNTNWKTVISLYEEYLESGNEYNRHGWLLPKQSFEEYAFGILHGLYSYDARLKYNIERDIRYNSIILAAQKDVFKSSCLNCYFADNKIHKVAQCYIPKGAKYIFLKSEGVYVSNKLYVKDIMTIEEYKMRQEV